MTDENPSVHIRTPDSGRSDAIEVSYQPADGPARRVTFRPRATYGPDYERIEEVRRDDGTWRPVGSELVDRVAVEDGRDA